MKKIILLMTALLSSTSVYAMCTPPTTLKCECAHPIIENGHLTCGPTYCPQDTTCMSNGACCKTNKVCGTSSDKKCCSDTETCVNGTTCCPSDKPYLDANGNCVQCTSDSHCGDKTCNTATYTCEEKSKRCTSPSQCGAGEKCCNYSKTCISLTECCGPADACSACKSHLEDFCYTMYCTPEDDCTEIYPADADWYATEALAICPSGYVLYCNWYAVGVDGNLWDAGAICTDPGFCKQ